MPNRDFEDRPHQEREILATWAEEVADRKGLLSYQVRVYTPNVLLKEFLEAEN